MTIRMSHQRKGSAPDAADGFTGFSEYTCENRTCVLSRFDRFSMADAPNAVCPVCGNAAVPAARHEPPSN